MMDTTPPAYVFFIEGHRNRVVPIRGRDPRFVGWLIRLLGRSEWVHVSIGHGLVVLDPALGGNSFWTLYDYAYRYPTLVWGYTVPVDNDPRLPDEEESPPRRKRILPTLLRWATGGLWPTNDCVQVVCRRLRAAGVHPPRRTTTPAQLWDWLRSEGYELTYFGTENPL